MLYNDPISPFSSMSLNPTDPEPGSVRVEWVLNVPDAAAEAASCAVTNWQDISRQTTTAKRVSAVSTFSTTPMVPADLEPDVLAGTESINTLPDSGQLRTKMAEFSATLGPSTKSLFLRE